MRVSPEWALTPRHCGRRGWRVVLHGAGPSMAEPITLDRGADYCGDTEPLRIVGVYADLARGGIGLPAAQTDLRAVLAD